MDVCILSGLDVACVQRWFANTKDSKCMHGLSMNNDCVACRVINCTRNPDLSYCDHPRIADALAQSSQGSDADAAEE